MFPPSRIVCFTEETFEMLYLLGEQARTIGISPLPYVVHPQARQEELQVSVFSSVNIGKILAWKPDLVLILIGQVIICVVRYRYFVENK